MAITLTQDWQVVAEHRWQPSTGFDFSMYLEARYTEQNTSTNSTKILTRLRSVVNKGQGSGYGYSFNCSYCSSISGTGQWFFGTETILESSEQTIYHENDGSKSLTLYASGYVNGVGYNFDINGVINFPKIDRLPIITSLTNQITDEDNIVLKFDNPGGFYIKAYFYRLSGYDFSRENITSPYTFELTDEERNTVRQFMKSMTVDKNASFTIEAYSSSDFSESSYIGEASTTMQVTIKDANPTITLTVTETNQKVIDLYGTNNASTVVKNLSQLKLVSTVGLKKYATLKSRTYTYNSNQTSSATTVTIVPTANKVSVKAVDSRNLSVSASKTLNMVDYLPMVINNYDFFRTSPTSSEIKLSADITYFQGTYNGTANAPVIQYKMGANGTLRTLTADDYTLDTTNKKITITNLVLTDTLVYTKAETFYLYVSDIFTSDTENDVVLKGVPTFEAGETDFQVNGTMYLANESGENEKELNVSGKVSKNLCNLTQVVPYNYGQGLPVSIATDRITINSFDKNNIDFTVNVNAYTYVLTNIIKLKPNTQYTLSYDRTNTNYSGSLSMCYLLNYNNGTYSQNTSAINDNGNSASKKFTTNSQGTVAFAWAFGNTGNGANGKISNIQIEKGSDATEYEEYYEPTLSIRNSNNIFQEVGISFVSIIKNLVFNSEYVYSEDLQYICIKIGNVVLLNINEIAFTQDTPNDTLIISGLPRPKQKVIFSLIGNNSAKGDTVRLRILNTTGEIYIHYGKPAHYGASSTKQYSGFVLYETED